MGIEYDEGAAALSEVKARRSDGRGRSRTSFVRDGMSVNSSLHESGGYVGGLQISSTRKESKDIIAGTPRRFSGFGEAWSISGNHTRIADDPVATVNSARPYQEDSILSRSG